MFWGNAYLKCQAECFISGFSARFDPTLTHPAVVLVVDILDI
jgi:hypothetical protein